MTNPLFCCFMLGMDLLVTVCIVLQVQGHDACERRPDPYHDGGKDGGNRPKYRRPIG